MMFLVSAFASLAFWHWAPEWIGTGLGRKETRFAVLIGILIISSSFGYWTAQRFHRRFDQLHFALKQAANGNLAVRIPETWSGSFTAAYREFNIMADAMERRMKLLQDVGERQVMSEAVSNEAAVLEERRRLARDLHDTVSQQLFAIHMSASALPKLLELDQSKADDVLQQLIRMSSLAQKQMRGFIAQLRPIELEERSLKDALEKWFPDYCTQNGLQGTLDWRIDEPLSEAKEHQFFLIIQEAMANIVKHASARSAVLTVAETERQLILTLQDDGAGFRADQVQPGSYGLSTMRERSLRLGGDAEIISKPGAGTKVRVTIPKYIKKELETNEHTANMAGHDRG